MILAINSTIPFHFHLQMMAFMRSLFCILSFDYNKNEHKDAVISIVAQLHSRGCHVTASTNQDASKPWHRREASQCLLQLL